MRNWQRGLALGLALFGVLGFASAQEKGVVIEIDDLKNTTPATWKEEKASKMRYMQFRLAKVGDDKDDAEIVIFKGLGGSAEQNIERWKGQFLPPQGKTIAEASKVDKVKLGKNEGMYLDVSGTYLFKVAPFDPNGKTDKKENYRMLAIQFEGPKDIYHIKLTGPAKTVESYKKGFDEWFNGLK